MKFDMIKNDREFRYIYKKGKSFANRNIVIYYFKNNINSTKVGISISKKVGKAVTRNRLRRLIKENLRLFDEIKSGYSIIFLVRVGSEDMDFKSMGNSLKHVLKKCNILYK